VPFFQAAASVDSCEPESGCVWKLRPWTCPSAGGRRMETKETQIESRKEFVEPTVTEEDSLTEVTLTTPDDGGVPEFTELLGL
jgi:hypothetical protein